jgi:hypothetical protein
MGTDESRGLDNGKDKEYEDLPPDRIIVRKVEARYTTSAGVLKIKEFFVWWISCEC